MRILPIVFLLLVMGLAAASSVSCAADAYRKACASCPFDKNGKIDQSCMGGYKTAGISCVSTSYPIMSAKYSAGKCPEVDACAAELQSCVSQYSTGNDRADCQEGSVSVCYSASDQCIRRAAIKCGEIENECPGSSSGIIIAVLGILGMAAVKRDLIK
ncbi:MAG: hypothetical protein QXS93_00740 [Candidatus Micrarchaeia archaeon]